MNGGDLVEHAKLLDMYLNNKSNGQIHSNTNYIQQNRFGRSISDYDMSAIKYMMEFDFEYGKEITIALNNDNNIKLTDVDTGVKMSTGSHAVKVTDITDDGPIVSTWGKKCFISYEDLQRSGKFEIYTTEISE